MEKQEFCELFLVNVGIAMNIAESRLGFPLPRKFQILLNGAGYSSKTCTIGECLNIIYIDENRFYRVIDIAIIQRSKSVTTCFVKVSGHQADDLAKTLNDPAGNGPFNQIIAKEIRFKE